MSRLGSPIRRRWMCGLAATVSLAAALPGRAQQVPRLPGNGIPVSRPDSQGATRTWSRMPAAELAQALRGGGYVIIFRHGRTDWRSRDQLPQTSFDDRSTQRLLSEEGREQGRRTAEVFRDLGVRFDAVYSSPYFRTRDFAELVTGRTPEVTRKLLGFDQIGLDGHRELLSRVPAAGTNTLLSGHQFAVTELGFVRMNELEEGSCLIFRPTGDRERLDMVAHLNHADLLALPSALDRPR